MIRSFSVIIVFALITSGCSTRRNAVFVESISKDNKNDEYQYDRDNTVYSLKRQFIYSCKIEFDNKEIDIDLKYIRLSVQGTTKPFSNFDPEYNQTVIQFEYLDKNFNEIIRERTGVIENDKNIWMHPPRNADLDVLQLSAFPYYKYGSVKNWKWELDAAYANYKDVHLTHTYKKGKRTSYKSTFGTLDCELISALTESYVGNTTSEFIFHDTYGFVSLKFNTVENTTIILDLIEVKD